MNNRFYIRVPWVTVAMMVLLSVSCQPLTQSIKDTFNTVPKGRNASQQSGNARVTGFVTNGEALAEAEQALRSLPQYQHTPIYLYGDIHFYDDGRIAAKLQHPTNPEYVDAYDYDNGTWSNPQAVQLSVNDDLESKLVALDSVPFSTAATVVQHYNEKAATVAGARSTDHVYLIIRYGIARWYPQQIDGTRELWHIFFHRDGSVASFERE